MNKTQRRIRWMTTAAVGLAMTLAGAAVIVAQDTPNQGRPSARGGGPGVGRGGPLGGGPMGQNGFMPLVPNLTDAQGVQMKSIAERHRAQVEPLMEQLRTARLSLEDAIVTSPVDDATIRLRSAEVANAEADLAVARAHAYADVVAILTPEQVKQLQTRRDRVRQRRQDGPPAGRR
jgi:Spy/CpxP family protein refolding chaperone